LVGNERKSSQRTIVKVPQRTDGDEVDNWHYNKRGNEAYEVERDILVAVYVSELGD